MMMVIMISMPLWQACGNEGTRADTARAHAQDSVCQDLPVWKHEQTIDRARLCMPSMVAHAFDQLQAPQPVGRPGWAPRKQPSPCAPHVCRIPSGPSMAWMTSPASHTGGQCSVGHLLYSTKGNMRQYFPVLSCFICLGSAAFCQTAAKRYAAGTICSVPTDEKLSVIPKRGIAIASPSNLIQAMTLRQQLCAVGSCVTW